MLTFKSTIGFLILVVSCIVIITITTCSQESRRQLLIDNEPLPDLRGPYQHDPLPHDTHRDQRPRTPPPQPPPSDCEINCEKEYHDCVENCDMDADNWPDCVHRCGEIYNCASICNLVAPNLLTQEEVHPEAIDLEMARVHLLGEEVSIEENAFEANLVTVQEAQTKIKTLTKKLSAAKDSLRKMKRGDDLELSAADSSAVETEKRNELEDAISEVERSIGAFGKAIQDSVAQVSDAKDEKQDDIEKYAEIAEVLLDLGISEEQVEKVLFNLDD